MLPYFALWAQYWLLGALFRPLGSIRALCCPISPFGLNTGFCRPISPFGLNTGSWRLLPVGQYAAFPGLRYATPRAVFWRPFRARDVGTIENPGLRFATPRAVFWRPFRARDVGTIENPGLRFATPRAVFWRPFRALVVGTIGWAGGRPGIAPRGCASLHPGLYSGAHSGREFPLSLRFRSGSRYHRRRRSPSSCRPIARH